jgi:hypothetical protein
VRGWAVQAKGDARPVWGDNREGTDLYYTQMSPHPGLPQLPCSKVTGPTLHNSSLLIPALALHREDEGSLGKISFLG